MSKHPRSGRTPTKLGPDDLARDPGIGQSEGATISREDPRIAAGENTAEGDVEHDTRPDGGVDPSRRGRSHP